MPYRHANPTMPTRPARGGRRSQDPTPSCIALGEAARNRSLSGTPGATSLRCPPAHIKEVVLAPFFLSSFPKYPFFTPSIIVIAHTVTRLCPRNLATNSPRINNFAFQADTPHNRNHGKWCLFLPPAFPNCTLVGSGPLAERWLTMDCCRRTHRGQKP